MALRSRAISGEIARVAREEDAGLILVGAVPHIGALAGRQQVFSETIENLLRRAHCRVIVTSFPPGTASVAEEAPTRSRASARARRPSRSSLQSPAADGATGAGPRRSRGPSTTATSSVATPMRDVERAQLDDVREQARARSPRPSSSAIAIARPVMPTRACRWAGAWRWRSPIAVVKLTHCARLSTIQIASTCQNAVETASASTRQAADDDARDDHDRRPDAPLEPQDHRPGGDADQRADAEHPADVPAVEIDDVAQERHDQRLGAVEREVPDERRQRDACARRACRG